MLPAGAVVGVNETLDAVDAGLIEAGFAWTHYWSGKHPAATLFGSPAAGAGVGLDNLAHISWYLYGGGRELYEQLWDEMGVNVVGFMLQPVGPEALGWFKEPITSLADMQGLRFRTPPGIPGQIYNDIGVSAVAMGGGDILPALEKGVIDAAEWCCPKPDSVFGFQNVLKNYYLQGLHQNVVNADIYINKDVFESLTEQQQKAIEVSANAALMKALSYRILENGKALKMLVEEDGVIIQDTPEEYFTAYAEAAQKVFESYAAENAFFKEVWDSQRAFAEVAIPFWATQQAGQCADHQRLRRQAGRRVASTSGTAPAPVLGQARCRRSCWPWLRKTDRACRRAACRQAAPARPHAQRHAGVDGAHRAGRRQRQSLGRPHRRLAGAAADGGHGLRDHRPLLLRRPHHLGLRHEPHALRCHVHAGRRLRAGQGRAYPCRLHLPQLVGEDAGPDRRRALPRLLPAGDADLRQCRLGLCRRSHHPRRARHGHGLDAAARPDQGGARGRRHSPRCSRAWPSSARAGTRPPAGAGPMPEASAMPERLPA